MNIIVTFCLLLFTAFMIYKIYREYKNSEIIDEKLIILLIVAICFTPIIIYYIDKSDLPSKFGWFKNSEPDKWFNFIATYTSSILGATIGALTLILVTIHEFKTMKENDNEQMRINNLPLINYDFSIFNKYNNEFIDLHKEEFESIFIMIHLKNIGMNAIRNCYINITSNTTSSEKEYKIDDQAIIEKNCEKKLVFKLPIDKNDNKIKLIVKYQDILFNWYEQEVNVSLDDIVFHEDNRGYVDYVTANITKMVKDEKKWMKIKE